MPSVIVDIFVLQIIFYVINILGKKNGVKVSPCRTPTLQFKRFDENPLMHIFDFFFFYLCTYSLCIQNILHVFHKEFIPEHISPLCIKRLFEIKSTNAQNNFYLLLISVCIKNCRTKILSVVKKTPCEYNNQI